MSYLALLRIILPCRKKYTGDFYFKLLTDSLFLTCSQKVDVKCSKPEVDIKNIKKNAL